MRQRASMMFLGLVVCLAVVALGSAGIAGGAENSAPQKCNVSDTGQDLGRDFCLDVKTFSGITASDPNAPQGTVGTRYTWVEFKLTNTGGTTLTNPRIAAALTDFCGTTACTSGTSKFVELPTNCTFGTSEAIVTCTYANIPAGQPTATTRVYFKTGDVPATSSRIDVAGTVKERGNDAGSGLGGCAASDPNCDTVSTFIINSYEPDANTGVSFALNGKQIYLATNDKNSSYAFKSGHASPFRADFTTTFPAECVAPVSPTCFYRVLNVRPASTAQRPTYNDGTRRLLRAAQRSPARGHRTNRHAPSTRTTTVTGLPTRIIGDVPVRAVGRQDEGRLHVRALSTDIELPSICAKDVKGMPKTIDVWVWDNDNGQIKWT